MVRGGVIHATGTLDSRYGEGSFMLPGSCIHDYGEACFMLRGGFNHDTEPDCGPFLKWRDDGDANFSYNCRLRFRYNFGSLNTGLSDCQSVTSHRNR